MEKKIAKIGQLYYYYILLLLEWPLFDQKMFLVWDMMVRILEFNNREGLKCQKCGDEDKKWRRRDLIIPLT